MLKQFAHKANSINFEVILKLFRPAAKPVGAEIVWAKERQAIIIALEVSLCRLQLPDNRVWRAKSGANDNLVGSSTIKFELSQTNPNRAFTILHFVVNGHKQARVSWIYEPQLPKDEWSETLKITEAAIAFVLNVSDPT